MILTGTSALYKLDIISYAPAKKHVEMLFGTNTTRYHKKYSISLQKKDTYLIGAVRDDDGWYYGIERLFIELQKFNMENTVKAEAIRALEKKVSPEIVKTIYQQLKGKRRNIDNEYIERFLERNLLHIKSAVQKSNDVKMLLREYAMALLSDAKMPVMLVKGGSAIELFIEINRTTLDVDVHLGREGIKEVVDFLCLKEKRDVYFKVGNQEKYDSFFHDTNEKRVLKVKLRPVSRGGVLKKELGEALLEISFNTIYNGIEMNGIIRDFGITKRRLKHLPNSSVMVFTREMLLAEKFHAIITKPEFSTRAKDLIDLKLIFNQKIKRNDFRKWLFRKWENSKDSADRTEAIKIINRNKEKPLRNFIDNFNDTIKMYSINFTYEKCLEIYENLTKIALEK